MCGRFALAVDLKTLIEAFGIEITPEKIKDLSPRYNIAPSQQVVGVYQAEDGSRQLDYFRWGLIPHWAKDEKIGDKMINARSETAAEKPAFRSSFRSKRCLIPASAFYEWKKEDKEKIPFCIRSQDQTPMAFAGLWDSWLGPEGVIQSCSILTTEANQPLKPLHDRMPVILQPEDYQPWLNLPIHDTEYLNTLLRPCPNDFIEAYEVDRLVNSPKNDNPECMTPKI